MNFNRKSLVLVSVWVTSLLPFFAFAEAPAFNSNDSNVKITKSASGSEADFDMTNCDECKAHANAMARQAGANLKSLRIGPNGQVLPSANGSGIQ